ncbi:Ribose import permease protein RbsC [subsurface metagenome]
MAENVDRPKSYRDTAKDIAQRFLRHENAALIIALIVLLAGMSVVTKGVTTSRVNLKNILVQSSTRGVAAVGQAFVILTAGIDISIAGVGLFCAALGGGLMTEDLVLNLAGYPVSPYIAVPLMLLVGACWGALNGSLVARVGMPALIVTLGMWQISYGAGFNINAGRTFSRQPQLLAFFGQTDIAGVPTPVIIFIAVAVVGYFVLNHTSYGRSIYAVGGNPVSAWLSGINVKNIQFSVFVISGFLAGLSALIVVGRTMAATMRTCVGLELDSIASAVVGGISLMGGRGSVIGAVIGALIIGVINNSMSVLGQGTDVQGIAKGTIIITAVAVDYIRRRRG